MSDADNLASRPLDGVRILDFSHVLAGPFCTRTLCDLGAEVIKVETPEGDLSRRLGSRRAGISGYYLQQNCGKRNVSIALDRPEGVGLAVRLARESDVLVENFRPGVMDALGLGFPTLNATIPGLVYCSISGFGHASPHSDQRAFAGIAHAQTGILERQSFVSGGAPTDSVLAVGDTVAGLQAVVGILAALRHRDRTGRGQHLDMAMHDALLAMQEAANFVLFSEDEGTEHDFLSSWIYPCGGRYIAVPTDPRARWEDFTALMGRPDLETDSRYDHHEKRAERLDELEAIIGVWIADQGDADLAVAKLHEAGMAGAKLLTLGEALASDQTVARNMTPAVEDRAGGTVRVLNTPYRFSESQAGVHGRAAYRGEDNRAVLANILGMDDAEMDALEAAGVISSRLPGPPTGAS